MVEDMAAGPPQTAHLLRGTFFIDIDHPTVAAYARDKAAGGSTPQDKAVRLFYAVRDEIRYDPYTIDLVAESFKASTTLERKKGYCVTKAILLAATWRAAGIPARLGFADVTNHLASKRLIELMGTDVFAFHGYAEAHLDGKWVKATPAFNAALCEKFGVAPLDWDGAHDAILQPHNRSGAPFMTYLLDRGPRDDFSLEELIGVWRERYPGLVGMYENGGESITGDLEAEATADRERAGS